MDWYYNFLKRDCTISIIFQFHWLFYTSNSDYRFSTYLNHYTYLLSFCFICLFYSFAVDFALTKIFFSFLNFLILLHCYCLCLLFNSAIQSVYSTSFMQTISIFERTIIGRRPGTHSEYECLCEYYVCDWNDNLWCQKSWVMNFGNSETHSL